MRRARAATLLAVAALVVPAGAAAPPACAASGTRVAVAVDFGDHPGSPGGTGTVCLDLGDRATGAEALAERARQLGTPPPRYAPSGLLCAIDGYPETGCGERTADGYAYWAYWHSDGDGWVYANDGPATHRVQNGDVDGWRFQVGADRPTDEPPRTSARFAELCPPPAPPPATAETGTPGPTPPAPPAAAEPPPAAAPLPPGDAPAVATDRDPDAPATTTSSTQRRQPAEPTAADGTAPGRLALDRPVPAAAGDGGGGPAAPAALAGVALALGLGGLAARRARRGQDT